MDTDYENTLINKWEDFNLKPEILRGIFSYGFEHPSPIQKRSIMPILDGKDIIAQAQSGTGKTACFTIGALSSINTETKNLQVIILSPTRELSIQTGKVLASIGNYIKNLKIDSCYDNNKKNSFSYSVPHVLCGCPGRVYEIIVKNKVKTDDLKMVILDEADEILSKGFKDQIMNIFGSVPNNTQVALFSATLPSDIDNVVNGLLRDPVKIKINAEQLTLEGISQYYVLVDSDLQKYETLKDLFKYLSISQSIIYCNSVKRVKDLYSAMSDDGFPVTCIHSNMERHERSECFANFRSGKSRVLISSNVTARGIDIQQVSVVINFDIPKDVHTYLHRIGRSGRWGRKGIGINFVSRRDTNYMREIEGYYQCQINALPEDINFLQRM